MTDFFTMEVSDPRFEAGGIRHINIKSQALGQRADITLFQPKETQQTLPIVILLHGVYASHWAWVYNGGVHHTAQKMIDNGDIGPMVLAMPSDGLWGDGSGYVPHSGKNFEQWIVEEVPAATRAVCNNATEESPLFIAGLSMGGFGALRLAAKNPATFSGMRRAFIGDRLSTATAADAAKQSPPLTTSRHRICPHLYEGKC